CSRPWSCAATGRGGASRTWSSRRSNGSTGSITAGCSVRSATCRRRSSRPCTTRKEKKKVRRRTSDPTDRASRKPGVIQPCVAEGSLVVARFTISGTQSGRWGVLPPTGKRVQFEEIVILELRDGRVVYQRGIPDNLTALRQLGVLSTPPSARRH